MMPGLGSLGNSERGALAEGQRGGQSSVTSQIHFGASIPATCRVFGLLTTIETLLIRKGGKESVKRSKVLSTWYLGFFSAIDKYLLLRTGRCCTKEMRNGSHSYH